MDIVVGILAIIVLVGIALVAYGVTIGSLLFGHRLPWLWFALAVFQFVSKMVSVALYRESDTLRGLVALGAAMMVAVLGFFAQRRFQNVVLVLGGFLGAGLITIQVLGPLLNPAPQWLVMGFLVAFGIAGAIWARTNPRTATIVLSALVGAGILTSNLVDLMGIDEAHRFQVQAILALAGIAFQMWRTRRKQGAALPQSQGA